MSIIKNAGSLMIQEWFHQFRSSNKQTKYFVLTWIVYVIAIIVSTLYAYLRIDWIESVDQESHSSVENIEKKVK